MEDDPSPKTQQDTNQRERSAGEWLADARRLDEGPNEVWIECEGRRVAIQSRYLKDALKLIREASEQ